MELAKSLITLKSVKDWCYAIFSYLSILWPSWYILTFKILGLHLSALFWVRSTYKCSSGCYKSNFKNKNNPICKKATPATRTAFLALKILKLKNNDICKSNTPNEATNMKKLRNFGFVDSLAYDLAFTTFVGLL